jgi:hypothetical protein
MASSSGGIFRFSRILRVSLLLLGALAALLVVTASDARSPWPSSSSAYSVSLEDEFGSPLRSFNKTGSTFVLGNVGARYNVRLRNHTDRRVEAVVSIDGRDAVSGRVGDFVRERGYVIPAYGSVLVDGFRQSFSQAAAFRFSSPGDSYSSRMGTPENVGVVGVAFFPERYVPRPRPVARPISPPREDLYDYEARTSQSESPSAAPSRSEKAQSRRAPAPEPSSPAAQPRAAAKGRARASESYGGARDSAGDDERTSRLGTEYGESRYSPVSEVAFRRQNASAPSAVITLRYDDERGLVARGIDVYPRRYWDEPRAAAPEPFPANRFAPPPPGY